MNHSHTPIALTGIHTDIGKTVCAAVLVRALRCDYWKPIQAGSLAHTDSDTVRELSDAATQIHPEAYRLQLAASPHTAARAEQVNVTLSHLHAPTERPLLIETAGGVCSPINDQYVAADLLAHYGWPTLLITRHYLGSISHTLSAIDALKARNIRILGLIVNGEPHVESEQFITQYSQLPILAHIERMDELSAQAVAQQAQLIAPQLNALKQYWTL